MIDLRSVYGELARSGSRSELERLYRDALRRGEADLSPDEPRARSVALLAGGVPRLASLAVAVFAIETLPGLADSPDLDVPYGQMVDLAQRSATGALLRCHLALDAELAAEPGAADTTDRWLAVTVESADAVLRELRFGSDERSATALAQEAAAWLANSIDLVDTGDPDRIAAICDTGARVFVLTTLADAVRRRLPPVA